MQDNVFLENKKELELADFMNYTDGSRGNLGKDIPVTVYRLLEYSLREQLIRQFGKETQVQVFQDAGFRAGVYFAENMLDLKLPLNRFISDRRAPGGGHGPRDRTAGGDGGRGCGLLRHASSRRYRVQL